MKPSNVYTSRNAMNKKLMIASLPLKDKPSITSSFMPLNTYTHK